MRNWSRWEEGTRGRWLGVEINLFVCPPFWPGPASSESSPAQKADPFSLLNLRPVVVRRDQSTLSLVLTSFSLRGRSLVLDGSPNTRTFEERPLDWSLSSMTSRWFDRRRLSSRASAGTPRMPWGSFLILFLVRLFGLGHLRDSPLLAQTVPSDFRREDGRPTSPSEPKRLTGDSASKCLKWGPCRSLAPLGHQPHHSPDFKDTLQGWVDLLVNPTPFREDPFRPPSL